MAVRAYIGARYVPKFMGTYDATQAYEALDVVDNGLGTSYISKIPTPAGTSLTDTTYWAIYGSPSGAIINLQNQIDNIVNQIDGIVLKSSPIYPEDYGAIGDGITDDTTALQSCLNDAKNKAVILRNKYKITNTLNVDDYTLIVGGEVVDAIAPDSTAQTGDTYLIHINNKKYVLIYNVHFTGGSATRYDGTEYYRHDLIEVDNSEHIKIVNNYFDAVNAMRSIIFHGAKYCNCDYNTFYYSRYTAVAYTDNSEHCTLNHNIYNELGWGDVQSYGFVFSTADHAGDYSTKYCTDIECNYNFISYVNTLSMWESISAHGAYDCKIIGNTIQNCVTGIASGQENVRNFTTVNCIIKDNFIIGRSGTDVNGSYGIYAGGEEIIIANNYLRNCGKAFDSGAILGASGAIVLDQSAINVTIDNNFLHNCAGILFYIGGSGSHPTGFKNVVIQNNVINDQAYGAGGRYLIYINDTAKLSNNIKFTKNEWLSNTTTPLIKGWSSTSDNLHALVIYENIFDAFPSYSDADKVITDYVTNTIATLSTLGIQGMKRVIANSTTSGQAALQIYSNAWYNVNLD